MYAVCRVPEGDHNVDSSAYEVDKHSLFPLSGVLDQSLAA